MMKNTNTVKLNNDWDKILKKELESNDLQATLNQIEKERNFQNIFPSDENVFKALKLTTFKNTKVIILGQDPYHSKGLANGLAFSVPKETKQPPSLKNIFKALSKDLKIPIQTNGNLESWAKQGVLLLNTVLTVKENSPTAHKNIGWEKFTDTIIRRLSLKKDKLVFLLWGVYAQKKEILINEKKHLILKTSHPSPFSAHRGFLKSNHFSKTNKYLLKHHNNSIYWLTDLFTSK